MESYELELEFVELAQKHYADLEQKRIRSRQRKLKILYVLYWGFVGFGLCLLLMDLATGRL